MCSHSETLMASCSHTKVNFCRLCGKVFCEVCKREWGDEGLAPLPYLCYPLTALVFSSSTREGLDREAIMRLNSEVKLRDAGL